MIYHILSSDQNYPELFYIKKINFHLTPTKASCNQVLTLEVWILLVYIHYKFFAAMHSGNNETPLVVQWLRLHDPNARKGPGLDP